MVRDAETAWSEVGKPMGARFHYCRIESDATSLSVAWMSVNINMTHLFARDQPSGISGRETRSRSFRQTVRDRRQTENHAISCGQSSFSYQCKSLTVR